MMKKALHIISYWMSALALIGLVACNKTPVTPSPDFDPETNTVKTKFTLSISTNSPTTKMPASTAQVDGNGFRGMDKVHLLTYSLKYTCAHGDYFMYKLNDESSKATRDYDLGSLLTETDIANNRNSRTVQLAVPLSVNAVMLYGMASKTGSDDEQGATVASGSALGTSIASLSFRLQNRLKDETAVDGFTGFGNLMAQIMTTITNAELSKHTYGDKDIENDTRVAFWWPIDETSKKFETRDANGEPFGDSNTPVHYVDGITYEYHTVEKVTWQQLGDQYEQDLNQLSALGQVMGRAFHELTTIRKDQAGDKTELRAGDAASVLRTVQDLAEQIYRTVQAKSTGWKEEISRLMAVEVQNRIKLFFQWNEGNVSYPEMGDLLLQAQKYIKGYSTQIGKYANALTANSNGNFFPNSEAKEEGFPTNLNLPRGAAIMTCARSSAGNMVFGYLDKIPAYGMNADPLPITNYRFPPELIYWANSGIYVSDLATDKLPEIPHTVEDWANADKWSVDWTPNGTISSTTRSVALMKQVNYGTALMRSTVQVTANPLLDNKHGIIESEANNEIKVGSNSFKVTGVFIGGIPDVVGWDFVYKHDDLPSGMTSNPFDKMIYDKVTSDVYVSQALSSPIYTLVWDSYRPNFEDTQMSIVGGAGEPKDQSSIFVALELVNNTGKDFWGELNLIRNGGTFYLVGKLDLESEKAKAKEINFPDEKFFHYPPFYDDGQTVKVKRVFMQDFVTQANFQIGETSLQHAYMTIPDLRSSQISLGLSVDLDWQEGLDFNVLLGNVAE